MLNTGQLKENVNFSLILKYVAEMAWLCDRFADK